MHLCSIEVQDVNYASLCNHRAIQTFLLDIAQAIGAKKKADPQTWELAIQEPPEHTVYGILALVPHGLISLEAYLSGENKGTFHLEVRSEKPVEKKRILRVVEKTFCERDSIGMKATKRLVNKAG